ncbi:MAG: hypothetical protein IAA97_03435 [Spirochaetes bacterium]|uniref:V-type ATP synthase subunit H n=1 Tax=Candidatus Ornithospirochaeta stercoripullorum TaxID=2840899 RepID=A0A9D9H5X1_9SPIO|nr:hypothetical protein [Candidatus Ornithospirochaeta stercoripullorum]
MIDDILSVEDQAAKIVEDAEKKAKETISEAHDEAQKIISEAVERVRENGKAEVDGAEELLEKHLAEYEEERVKIEESSSSVSPDVLEKAVTRIVERICRTGNFGA